MAAARKHKPDIITLDVGMPRKSGVFFYRRLKRDIVYRKCRKTPVVFVTGVTRDKEMGRIVHSFVEADDVPSPQAFLEKPIDGPELIRTLQEVLSAR